MKITIPTTWADVTLNQFIELAEVPDLGFDPLDTQLRILQILSGESDEHFLKVPYVAVKELINKTDFINHTPHKLKIPKDVHIEDRSFRINYDIASLTAGEFIDLNELTKDAKKINSNMVKIIAIYLRPVNFWGGMKKGCYHKTKDGHLAQTLESRRWTEERIGDCITMDMVFPMSSFFLTLWERLSKDMEQSFQKRAAKEMKKANELLAQEQDLVRSTDGY